MARNRRSTGTKRHPRTRRKVKAPKRFPKVPSAAGLRRMRSALASAELAGAMLDAASEPIDVPPKTLAQMADYIGAFLSGVAKGVACEKSRQALEQIEDTLDTYGSQLSAEDTEKLKKLGDQTWNGMASLGC
jgi:hypothetical protein